MIAAIETKAKTRTPGRLWMGTRELGIKNDRGGKFKLVDAKTGRNVMCGFESVRAAVAWARIDWN